jgi:hypothetical protein
MVDRCRAKCYPSSSRGRSRVASATFPESRVAVSNARPAPIHAQEQSRLWLLPLLAVVGFIYAYWSAAGRFSVDWPMYTAYFDLQAEGFRRGQLSLPIDPAPELLAAANPYDRAYGKYWLVDATLHNGKWYLYWGPLPALLQALVKSLLGIDRLIGDQFLVIFFSLLSTLFGALLIEDLRQRMFSGVPRWVSVFCILALAFANPIVYLVATAGHYQASIAGGQAFLVGGVWCAYRAVQGTAADAQRRRWLLLSGCALGAALACRISLAVAAVVVAALTLVGATWPCRGRWRALLLNAFCLGVAPVLSVAGLLLYNKLRFQHWLEFGTKEQVSYFEFRLSTSYLLTNLYAYVLSPFRLTCQFPYALQSMAHGPMIPTWVRRASDYLTVEPMSGFLSSAPITWLSPVPLLVAARHALQLRREAWRSYAFSTVSFAVLGSLTGAVVLFVYCATMRYLADFIYGLLLLSALGAFTCISALRAPLARALAGGAVAALSGATVALGLLLGYQGYNDHFARFNPQLHARLVTRLSLCDARPANAHAGQHGVALPQDRQASVALAAIVYTGGR